MLVPEGGSMQRKVAYVFLYKNGIRERSVGIVRRYGTAEQPEVALELFGEEERRKRWRIYYFTKGEALTEAAYLWGSTTERGKSEVRLSQCRLCAEAGMGEGVVLLPERVVCPERSGQEDAPKPNARAEQWNRGEQASRSELCGRRQMTQPDLREYLCARYDGTEVTEEALRQAFRRKPEPETGENPCVESAKRLMEEIAKAAGGETAREEAASIEREYSAETAENRSGEGRSRQGVGLQGKKKRRGRQIAYLEELLLLNPPYVPCRRYQVEYSVRITPEELTMFPKEGKRFAENSFVLHAYYNYRHVLLGRRVTKDREDYVLLVPGSYNEKEARLAELFGFPEFLPVTKTKPETGSAASGKELFGYWCGKI